MSKIKPTWAELSESVSNSSLGGDAEEMLMRDAVNEIKKVINDDIFASINSYLDSAEFCRERKKEAIRKLMNGNGDRNKSIKELREADKKLKKSLEKE